MCASSAQGRSRRRHKVGQLSDEGDLLVAIERASAGQDLNPHVFVITVYVGDRPCRYFVDEGGRIFPEHRNIRDLLYRLDDGGRILRELVDVRERADERIDVAII